MKPKTKKRLIIALIVIVLTPPVIMVAPGVYEVTSLVFWFVKGLLIPVPNYTDTILKIAEPAQKELEIFYKKNKRFPNTKERNTILEHSGCKIANENVCEYGGISINISSKENAPVPGAYKIYLSTGYSRCGGGLYLSNYTGYVKCYQDSPITLKQ